MKKPTVRIVVMGGSMEGNVEGLSALNADESLVEQFCVRTNVAKRLGLELEFSIICRKDSGAIEDGDREKLKETITKAKESNIAGVLVVHGEDAMAKTLAHIQKEGALPLPVVCVSSNSPISEAGSDGGFVLAQGFCLLGQFMGKGVREVGCVV
ncbi:MAG: asparaginase [Patescibacteria group bacterium]|nr:asparaginase [Patescibacteria group bacterium]